MEIQHVASYYPKGRKAYLFLYLTKEEEYQWEGTSLLAPSLDEALSLARETYSRDYFSPLNCGFRYHLPIRDETGTPAFFWQMAQSYATSNGHYFDKSVGHMCYVDFASKEALELWRKSKP